MGLPGAGKTTLASKLAPLINAKWLNADEVRKKANDWDFSEEGRLRQSLRMSKKADEFLKQGFNVVADFVSVEVLSNPLNGAHNLELLFLQLHFGYVAVIPNLVCLILSGLNLFLLTPVKCAKFLNENVWTSLRRE